MNGLLRIRKERGLTQKKLAELMRKGQSTIAQWESGKRRPTIDDLKALAEIFGCSTDALLANNATAARPNE